MIFFALYIYENWFMPRLLVSYFWLLTTGATSRCWVRFHTPQKWNAVQVCLEIANFTKLTVLTEQYQVYKSTACRGETNEATAPGIQGRGASKEWNYKN